LDVGGCRCGTDGYVAVGVCRSSMSLGTWGLVFGKRRAGRCREWEERAVVWGDLGG
jgi:hypothetical protein